MIKIPDEESGPNEPFLLRKPNLVFQTGVFNDIWAIASINRILFFLKQGWAKMPTSVDQRTSVV